MKTEKLCENKKCTQVFTGVRTSAWYGVVITELLLENNKNRDKTRAACGRKPNALSDWTMKGETMRLLIHNDSCAGVVASTRGWRRFICTAGEAGFVGVVFFFQIISITTRVAYGNDTQGAIKIKYNKSNKFKTCLPSYVVTKN